MTQLQKHLQIFTNERIVEKLYENGLDNNSYAKEASKMIQEIRERLGEESNVYEFVCKLSDLYCSEMVLRDEKAYALGLRDGLRFEKALSDIIDVHNN